MRGIWFDYGDFKYPNDRHEAYHSYKVAAKQGYSRAEYRLGKMCLPSSICSYIRYEDGSDMKRAVYHYERGVAQGDSASLYVRPYIKRPC
jgi:TPR repeat protein